MNDRLYLIARVICVALALPLLPLTVVVGIMLLRGPNESPLQGLLLMILGGGAICVVLYAAVAPQQAAAVLPGPVARRNAIVRAVVLGLAAAGIGVPILSLMMATRK